MASAPDFDPHTTAKTLLRTTRSGTLATVGTDGAPYASLVAVASGADGAPLLLISDLAWHTRNLRTDPRASLLLDAGGDPDPLRRTRMTIAAAAAPTRDEADRRRYLACHPEAEAYAGFKDFGFWRLDMKGAHLVAGFGRIVDLAADELRTDLSGAEGLMAAEGRAVAHMNADHADALHLYATRLLGGPDGDWRCVGCDPEGLDLQQGRMGLRLPFPQRVTDPGALRTILKQLADQARAA